MYYNRQKTLKNCSTVLDAVRNKFYEAKEFIDNSLTEECEKEKITVDEVINLLQV